MYKVFVADKLAPEGIAALAQHPELEIDFSPGLDVAEAISHARDADAIIVRSATKIRGDLLDAARNLKVIGRAGIGVDNIDLDETTERGIAVLNTPDANATTTAELAIAHMFSLSRNLTAADQSVRAGKWEPSVFLGTELAGKTVGVVGFGTIGRLLAERCRGLKMRVVAFDPYVTDESFVEHGVEKMAIDELISTSDYVSLHCPVTDGTRGLMSRGRLLAMKPGARLVNCARGGLIDEAALAEVIASGHLAGAALDVFENEPPGESPLFGQTNIHFTPHLGAATHEAQTAVGVEIAHQIAAFLVRGEAINSVNLPSIAPDKLAQLSPYMDLARKLGKLLCRMAEGAYTQVEVGLYGEAAKLETRPIASAAMVGLLCEHLSVPVNQVNAMHLARRQGIHAAEVSSADSRDYVSLIRITASGAEQQICLEGAIFDGRRPRLVRVNKYQIESPLEGHLLFTRHADQPGVIGALGEILGRKNINISRMQVGVANDNDSEAIAVLEVSDPLDAGTLQMITQINAVSKALQVDF